MKYFLLLLLIVTSLFSQKTHFSLIIHKPFNAALFDVTEDYDRTMTAVGFSKNFKKNNNNSQSYSDAFEYLANTTGRYGAQMHIIKIDNEANIIFSKISKLPKFNKAIAVVKTPSNGYFVGGYTIDGSLLLVKLNANANLLYYKIFGTKKYDRMNNLVPMSDGGVLAVGSSFTSRLSHDNIFTTGLGNKDIFLTRFSKDGKKLWSKKYGSVYDDRGIDAVQAKDGSIIVISTTSYKKNKDVNFMRITENGNKIWLKHYTQDATTKSTIIPKKIIRLKDNNFVVILTQYDAMHKEHIRVVKFDLYQNILLDKKIFTTYPSAINDIKEYSNGTFIAVGYVKDVYDTDGLAMIFDSNFVLLNQEHYGASNYDVFHAVHILDNFQAVVVGVHTDQNSQETNMWITKLNHDASMAQIPGKTESFYQKICVLFQKEIQLHELVIKKDLTIELTRKTLYFSVGKYILSKKQKDFLNSFSAKLLPFLYENRAKITSVEVNGHTSSEWDHNNFTKRYLKNEKLSLNRAYETMNYIFKKQTPLMQKWLAKVFRDSGYSYSKNVVYNSIEDKKKSRRVSFKIILKRYQTQ